MKTTSSIKQNTGIILVLCFFQSFFFVAKGQNEIQIKGLLKAFDSEEVLSFATVTLLSETDSSLITGTLSNVNGEFTLYAKDTGNFVLNISYIGYKSLSGSIHLTGDPIYNAGIIMMTEENISIEETVITGERIKARKTVDRTTFFVNKKMQDASHTGVDILKFIPGIQIDFMQNITLEGNRNILILIDGKERDKNYLHQLNANDIDKIEIVNTPGAEYDADVSGVINVILKKEHATGLSGHIYTEIPVLKSEVYCFPAYSLNFGYKKINLYTSYNGDIRYFDLIENEIQLIRRTDDTIRNIIHEEIRQKDWSHRFHYGFDYYLNKNNQFNFYAFYNPYACKDRGITEMQSYENNILNENPVAHQKDIDETHMQYYSLYYKHTFNKPGHELSADINYFRFHSKRTIAFFYNSPDDYSFSNSVVTVYPTQYTTGYKADYTFPANKNIKLSSGIKSHVNLRKNNGSEEFDQTEKIFAAYCSSALTISKYTVTAGIRAENSQVQINEIIKNNKPAFLPHGSIYYEMSSKKSMQLSYKRSIDRPMLNEINPHIYEDNPYSIQFGNPSLNPAFINNVHFEYSIRPKNNYMAIRIYYSRTNNAIGNFKTVNNTTILETTFQNLGNYNKYGISLTGTLKPFGNISVNSYFNIFGLHSVPKSFVMETGISRKHSLGFNSGVSVIVSFKHDFTLSCAFEYNIPEYVIQKKSTKSALYFVSVEKTIKQNFKLGLISCVPFIKTFNDKTLIIKGDDFYNQHNRDIELSFFPIMFKAGYQFKTGKKINKINREKDIIKAVEPDNF